VRIDILTTETQMRTTYPLLRQLNPNLTPALYHERLSIIVAQGHYFQIVAMDGERALGLAGIWIGMQLWCGKFLEVDNVVVDAEARGSGVGTLLMEWAESKARQENCAMIRLDTYVTLEQAQRFYFARGFKILGFHMTKDLTGT
jgi:GNAT superfamily N-acetyltransferase